MGGKDLLLHKLVMVGSDKEVVCDKLGHSYSVMSCGYEVPLCD